MDDKLERFERSILPHLDAAYNLARWLTRNDTDAQDVVQEATLRAFKFFSGFRGTDGRSWLLRIVRNAYYTWSERNRRLESRTSPEEDALTVESRFAAPDESLLRNADDELLRKAIGELPVEFRETLILRELDGMSYKEIAGVAGLPLGTVMSRLARARRMLRERLLNLSHGNE